MKKILLVDDDEDMAAMCELWLTKAGYDVSVAYSGEEAIDTLIKEGADVVLLDMTMPDMNGEETLRHIRENVLIKDTPVFFRTGMEDGQIPESARSLNPVAILPKSEGKTALLASLESFFG